MQLGPISGFNPIKSLLSSSEVGVESSNGLPSFEDALKKAIEEVNDTQVKAYDSMKEIATGNVKNLQEAVMKIEEAELSLKLGLEVKNKAISAYKEIMRMQI